MDKKSTTSTMSSPQNSQSNDRSNQSGLGVIAVLLLLVIISVIGVSAYVVGTRKNSAPGTTKAATAGSANKAQEPPAPTKATITDVTITLSKASDVDKLPSATPASFKTYLAAELNKNPVDGCYVQYSISKISAFNIKGGGTDVNASGVHDDTCIGGSPELWVLTPAGTWESDSVGITCTSQNGGLVYEEFAPMCFISNDTNAQQVTNPNGSVQAVTVKS